jgi:uracil phosphoribosyltransferase
MEIHILNQTNSILNTYLAEIRDYQVQKDPLRFRVNLQRIGHLMAYEISRKLNYRPTEIDTPLGTAHLNIPSDKVVVASILRAGLPFHQGFLDVFDRAENAFIAAYRKQTQNNDFEISLDYISAPSFENKILILADPMLATAQSFVKVYRQLVYRSRPIHTHLSAIIGARPGFEHICSELSNENATLWLAALDEELDEHFYIVPGLGDAGDLAFGIKE